jgi:phenylalanyl-tRNA synthetase beta chain
MIYSRKLFEKFLPEIKNKSDHDLISACGQIGTEIEHIYKHPKLENFVIGEILSHEKHPNADKLNVCKVKIDKKGTINTIVCGASNVTDNKKVIVALANAQMVDGRVIEYKELRGVKSEGMLCAYAELTNNTQFLSSSDEHKIILLDDAEIGDEEVGKYIGLNDTLYDISIPFANRNDFNGVLSLCQELAGFFDMKFKYPEVSIDNFDSKKINITFEKDSMKCYCISKVENVNCDKDSP